MNAKTLEEDFTKAFEDFAHISNFWLLVTIICSFTVARWTKFDL